MNKVILKGNLVADPEARSVGAKSTPLTKFRLAVNDFKKTVFIDVDTWEKTAQNCAKFLTKGSPVLVEGRLELDEWEDQGKKRSKVYVVGTNVEFLGKSDDAPKSESTNSVEDDDDVPF